MIDLTTLETKGLILKHNELVEANELDDIWTLRMEINKRTGCMDWESTYKHLDLGFEPDLYKRIEYKNRIINKPKQEAIKVIMEVKEVLQKCVIDGNIVRLPEGQLDRKLYQEVAKTLNLIGGKWKGDKSTGFVFQEDPTELLKQVVSGVKINLKKEFQFFATPSGLADKLVGLAEVKKEHLILEPSAGQGAIVNAINRVLPNKDVFCCELMDVNASILKKIPTVVFTGKNFMSDDCISNPREYFDRIIANPPFSKNQDIDHVYKMYESLKKGGRLVSITSEHWELSSNNKEKSFRMWLKKLNAYIMDIDAGVFKESGTTVGGKIIIINKV